MAAVDSSEAKEEGLVIAAVGCSKKIWQRWLELTGEPFNMIGIRKDINIFQRLGSYHWPSSLL